MISGFIYSFLLNDFLRSSSLMISWVVSGIELLVMSSSLRCSLNLVGVIVLVATYSFFSSFSIISNSIVTEQFFPFMLLTISSFLSSLMGTPNRQKKSASAIVDFPTPFFESLSRFTPVIMFTHPF